MSHVADRSSVVIMDTYGPRPRTFVSGDGVRLFDDNGKSYLDCLGGLAVVAVGHANPAVTKAVADQVAVLTHTSNLFHTEPQVELAEKLVALSEMDRVFFANCGATANEAAIKLARRHGQARSGPDRYRIVSLNDSFHGRTLATLAATGQPAKQATFAPLPVGFDQVPGGDIDAMAEAVDESVAAVMLEVIQGEGGVIPWSADYVRDVRSLCDESGTLLIIDDVQAGMGRTGNWFSWQDLNIEPDIASVAKALANGLPIGACLATAEVAGAFQPGDHATTFGGGPVVCAAALATITEIEDRGLLNNALARGQQLRDGLMALDGVSGVRGKGLLLAAVLDDDLAPEVVAMALGNGLIVNAVRPNAVRWAPPLSITGSEIDDAVAIFEESLSAIRRDSDGH
ncbi:MAG: acetylornithine transaminase [Acidimicrobiia bacterium]|nr:acetylornithine transaminase [Acidimicrobiia bacterium]